MKRIFILSALLMLFSGLAFSQTENMTLNIGIDGGFPTGDFGKGSNVGIGGSLKGFYGLTEESQIGLNIGYIGFGAKGTNDMIKATTSIIPIMADYRHSFSNFYVEPQVGLAIVSSKVKMDIDFGDDIDFGYNGTHKSSSTGLGWALGAGVVFDKFDVSARYQGASRSGGSFGFAGIRLGYSFGL